MKKSKVYCGECRYFYEEANIPRCAHPSNVKDGFSESWERCEPTRFYNETPMYRNRNKDCPDFSPKSVIVRLLRRIG